jgi:VanZ family protein
LFYRVIFFAILSISTTLAFLPDYSNLPPIVEISDLLNHATAFTVLTLLYRISFSHSWNRLFASLFLYAVFIEFVQYFLPTRCASFEDIAADGVGMFLGFLGNKWMRKIRPAMGRVKAD